MTDGPDDTMIAAARRCEAALATVAEQQRRIEDVKRRYFAATHLPDQPPDIEGAEQASVVGRACLVQHHADLVEAATELTRAVVRGAAAPR